MEMEFVHVNSINNVKAEKIDIAISQSLHGDSVSPVLKKDFQGDKKADIARHELDVLVKDANKEFKGYDRRLDISVHEKTGQLIVKVINTIDDSVVREIPSEKMLDFVANVREKIGINIDESR